MTSLPGEFGIGNLRSGAKAFLGLLEDCGQTCWQFCPVGPTSFGNSPYSSLSAFAGNPLLIDLSALANVELLDDGDLDPLRRLPEQFVDYDTLEPIFQRLLEKAFISFSSGKFDQASLGYGNFDEFKSNETNWLDDYCLYRAFKTRYKEKPWYEWPKTARHHPSANKYTLTKEDRHYVQFHQFQQFLFDGQWKQLQRDAKESGVKLIGDAPIFVAHDSADVWANPGIFALGKDGSVTSRAGVPPDYFAEKGQLWGNPVYNWRALKKQGYKWWVDRIRCDLARYDWLRLDHFRGFYDFWAIPKEAEDATTGKWEKGPGLDFFMAVGQAKGIPSPAPIIAEDLGEMGQEVFDLRDAAGLPGMKVFQFAFGGDSTNPHLPHNIGCSNTVVYPGTHDNDTCVGWYAEAGEKEKDYFRRYLGVDGNSPSWDMVRAACSSVANLALYRVQDLLSLGTDCRFNTPGVAEGNWRWRCTSGQIEQIRSESAGYLKEIGARYGRNLYSSRSSKILQL
jgi:4-alpha-glucanotransferase